MEIEIGRGKRGRRAYGLDDIAIVPSRRTRDPEDVDLSWKLGPHTMDMPLLASAMDGVVNPATAIKNGQLGGLGVLNLEGIQSRYEDPDAELKRIAEYPPEKATRGLPDIYRARDGNAELMVERIKEIKAAGVLTAGSLTPAPAPYANAASRTAGARRASPRPIACATASSRSIRSANSAGVSAWSASHQASGGLG